MTSQISTQSQTPDAATRPQPGPARVRPIWDAKPRYYPSRIARHQSLKFVRHDGTKNLLLARRLTRDESLVSTQPVDSLS